MILKNSFDFKENKNIMKDDLNICIYSITEAVLII